MYRKRVIKRVDDPVPPRKSQPHCTPAKHLLREGLRSAETSTVLPHDASVGAQIVRRRTVVAPDSLLKNRAGTINMHLSGDAPPGGLDLWHAPAAVVMDTDHPGRRSDDWEVGTPELRALLRTKGIFQHLLRHPSARLLVDDLEQTHSPKAILASRLLTVGSARIEDRAGRTVSIGPAFLARLLQSWWRDRRAVAGVLDEAERRVADLERVAGPRRMPTFARESGVLFLRTDWARGVKAGGSVAHLAGVLKELQLQVGNVHLLTSDAIPLLDDRIRVFTIQAEARTWTRPELHQLHFNRKLSPAASALAPPGCIIYQRYAAFNWTGAALSRQAGLPFVLEFNGSEAWLAEQWGVGLRYPELAARIEQANLEAADLISVVSEPLRQHVLARGIQAERIIVLPNGVDPERFRPDLDGAPMRERLGLGGRRAIGFIGTFGPWHGVETLAEAFIRLLRRRPDLNGEVALVLIGDGSRRPGVKSMLQAAGALGNVVLTGLVPQAEGPAYLAACDILALPTVPNPDGSLFFGSPTKLFEYMAMGRPIVATSLGQTTEVLADGRNALLVAPSDSEAMCRALERVIGDPDLGQKLGMLARQDVLQRHTWQRHVAGLLARMEAFAGADATRTSSPPHS
jgi:glycosyltransferase involved in cell wall biosynthesis